MRTRAKHGSHNVVSISTNTVCNAQISHVCGDSLLDLMELPRLLHFTVVLLTAP